MFQRGGLEVIDNKGM